MGSSPMEKGKYIVIEGPIGVGKTSLVNLLAKRFSAKKILEAADENPFLPQFYDDKKRHAFQTQLFFLLSRFRQQQELAQQDLFQQFIVADYLFDRDRIFAYLNLDDNELALYEQIYGLLKTRITVPDVVIYLQASTDVLVERIAPAKPRLREAPFAAVPRGAQPGLQLLLLPLLGDAAAGHQHQRHRFRAEPGRPRRPRQPDPARQARDRVLHAGAIGREEMSRENGAGHERREGHGCHAAREEVRRRAYRHGHRDRLLARADRGRRRASTSCSSATRSGWWPSASTARCRSPWTRCSSSRAPSRAAPAVRWSSPTCPFSPTRSAPRRRGATPAASSRRAGRRR